MVRWVHPQEIPLQQQQQQHCVEAGGLSRVIIELMTLDTLGPSPPHGLSKGGTASSNRQHEVLWPTMTSPVSC